ncbi:hypothetical protein C8F04DRAFT_1313397 [Mycena alexandri]|uniref:Uncharacterized protein n=1 Tax=Mycena alexandri TaxID=1745969 RepID=A0AAD6WS97_9AGAR|nr:hypothetical protein C8F04DRAFT_1313397 [Mycena alexandri]
MLYWVPARSSTQPIRPETRLMFDSKIPPPHKIPQRRARTAQYLPLEFLRVSLRRTNASSAAASLDEVKIESSLHNLDRIPPPSCFLPLRVIKSSNNQDVGNFSGERAFIQSYVRTLRTRDETPRGVNLRQRAACADAEAYARSARTLGPRNSRLPPCAGTRAFRTPRGVRVWGLPEGVRRCEGGGDEGGDEEGDGRWEEKRKEMAEKRRPQLVPSRIDSTVCGCGVYLYEGGGRRGMGWGGWDGAARREDSARTQGTGRRNLVRSALDSTARVCGGVREGGDDERKEGGEAGR